MGNRAERITGRLRLTHLKEELSPAFPKISMNRNSGRKVCLTYCHARSQKNIGVCWKHFPPECPRKKKGDGSLVLNSTTCFGNTSSNLFVQTTTNSRETVKCNVTAESRTSIAAAREEVLDTIELWDDLIKYYSKFSPEHFVDLSDPTNIKKTKVAKHPNISELMREVKEI